MPRPPRADEAGGLYHALNRGNLRADIFRKEADFAAFERILHEGLQCYRIELYSYQLMSNHYHLVFRPLIDGEMSRFMGWIGGTHTMRYHAHYHTSGLGHVSAAIQKLSDSGRRSLLRRLPVRRAKRLTSKTGGSRGRLALGIFVAMVAETRT